MKVSDGMLAVFALALGGGSALGQEIEPRAYSNIPVGINFLALGYVYGEGGLAVDASVPLTNANLQVHTGMLGYARSLDLWGRSGKVDVLIPYAGLSGDAEYEGQPVSRDVSGFGDPRLRLSMNFIGAPALSMQEFSTYRQDLIVGASLQLGLPAGQYDADRLVNIGTHRWFVKPELGASKAWGPWTLELSAAATIFGDNKDFFGGQLLEQDPVYSVQGHLVYTSRSGIWAALTGTYLTGGRRTIDGVTKDDRQESSRVGATLSLPVDRRNSIKLFANSGLFIRTGTDIDALGAAWQYRWGGGL